jgi:mannose-6-phosphate isomerase-like protein (cupin superfamily)
MAQAYDLEEVLDTVTFLEGRTIHTDTKGTFARVSDYRDGGIFTGGFSGTSQWERHPSGDEIVQILKGAVTLTLKSRDKIENVDLTAGMIAIVPQNTWHQFNAPDGVTLMTTTPQPTEHIEDAEPPFG